MLMRHAAARHFLMALALSITALVQADETQDSMFRSTEFPAPSVSFSTGETESRLVKIPSFTGTSSSSPAPRTYAGNYLIVAPKVVRPGLPYSASVNIFKDLNTDHIVRVEIRTDKNETIGARAMSNLKIGTPQIVTIENLSLESLIAGRSYKLYVRVESADGKMIFEEERPVQCSAKSLSIFVQTDKAIYKPGSTVFYRVVVVNPDLLPYNDEISVRIIDPDQNIITQILNAKLNKGVFSGRLELASEPPLGAWLVRVETTRGAARFEKEFSVERYVLPKFDVALRTPAFITLDDDLSVFLDAKYTYGRGVAGKARLAVRHPFAAWIAPTDDDAKGEANSIERTVELNSAGEATVIFTNEELRAHKLIMDYGGSSVRIDATVTEQLTDIQRNATVEIIAYEHDVKLEIEKQGETFKPGLHYNVLVALKHMDETPIKASVPRRVQVTIFYSYTSATVPPSLFNGTAPTEDKDVKIVDLDAHGTALISLTPPVNCTSARVEAYYDREGRDNFTSAKIYNSLYVEAGASPSDAFLQLTADNEGVVDAGKTLSFSVKATEPVPSIIYQVVARGLIITSQELSVSSDSATITFAATTQMAPRARLVVFAIRPANKEILVDAVDFKVNGLFLNDVSLLMDRNTAEPGDPVKFIVRAAPNSFVGLLAVDQSVLLLKSGNDITRELVEQDVEEYDTTSNQASFGSRAWESRWTGRRRRSIWTPWWSVSGKDASSVFENAGLVVLTDAFLYKEPEPIIHYMRRYMLVSSRADGAHVATNDAVVMRKSPNAAKSSRPLMTAAPPRVRREFPESWIVADFVANSESGEAVYEAKVPDTITTWVASAFAINDEMGLGVAPTVSKLKVFRPFFIRLNLPYSVKRGEKMALQVLVFNYLENEQDVTVTLKHSEEAGFEFLQKGGSTLKKGKGEKNYNIRYVSVPGGGATKAVYFPIVLNTLGTVRLAVVAQAGAVAGDAVDVALRVEPDGYRVERNAPMVLDLSARAAGGASNASANFIKTLTMDFPALYVDGSRRARIDVIGDIMGPVLANVESLVQMPFGCGEQNMVTFVPNIVVLSYLRGTRREVPSLEAKSIRYMETGYQRQLSYRRSDNSFSAFGQSDRHGSTWLTAFVVRSFKQAKAYIFIDQQIIDMSIAFLISQQQTETGAFAERGEIHHKQMQSGAAEGGVALTAYVMIALLENGVRSEKGLAYLEAHLVDAKQHVYETAVIAYALQLAGSAKAADALAQLDALRITNDNYF